MIEFLHDEKCTICVGIEAERGELINLVSNFYNKKLTGPPEIKDYMEEIKNE